MFVCLFCAQFYSCLYENDDDDDRADETPIPTIKYNKAITETSSITITASLIKFIKAKQTAPH